MENAAQNGHTIEFETEDEDDPEITHRFRILNVVPLNRSNLELPVNFIEYWEHSKKAEKITYHNTWITDFTLTMENAYIIMRGGRARWKIENETFNTLKNQGCNFGHNYGLGEKNSAVVFAMLMMSAFPVDQIRQLCRTLFQSVWKKLRSEKALWESIRSLFKCFQSESMEMLYNALLYGFKAEPPVILFDTS